MNKVPLIQFIIALGIALSVLGGYVLWYNAVQRLSSDIGSLQTQIAKKDIERARATSARSAEADLRAQESFVTSHFVVPADIVLFLEALEKTGKTFGATVHVASVTGDDASSKGRISLSLAVSGTFDAVMRTVGAIEHGPYANMVNDLTIDTVDDGATWTATGVFIVGTVTTK